MCALVQVQCNWGISLWTKKWPIEWKCHYHVAQLVFSSPKYDNNLLQPGVQKPEKLQNDSTTYN